MSILKSIHTQRLLGNDLGSFGTTLHGKAKTWEEFLEQQIPKAPPLIPLIKPIRSIFDLSEDKEEEEMPETLSSIETQKVSDNVNLLIKLIQDTEITRDVDTVWIHCTATQPTASVSSIENYWYNTLKWKNAGYHILFKADGTFSYLQNFNAPSNGVQGHNKKGINISYIGGIDPKGKPKDTRTEDQKFMLELAIKLFMEKKKLKLRGHNEVANKACPSFKVKDVYSKYL